MRAVSGKGREGIDYARKKALLLRCGMLFSDGDMHAGCCR